jgi:hypothetical protein
LAVVQRQIEDIFSELNVQMRIAQLQVQVDGVRAKIREVMGPSD